MEQPQSAVRIFSEEDFRRLLEWEVQRATRYQDFLSLCLVRVDHAPEPHPGLLPAIARRAGELLRSTDLVGTIGDCVAILLVHTPDHEAILTVERLRGRVEADPPDVGGASASVPGMSLGLASFPADATGCEALLDQARARLDEAERSRGRSSSTP